MPDIATQRRTDLISHRTSRALSRWVGTQIGPHAHIANTTWPKTTVGRSSQLSAAAETDVLEERARIARELHDSVAQTLYAIALVAGRALALPEVRATACMNQLFDQVLQLASDGQTEVRELLSNLYAEPQAGEPQDVSISDALVALAAKQERCHGLEVRLALAPEREPVAPRTAQMLVAIAHEALSNSARHAGATQIEVQFATTAESLTLVIADNGRGFDAMAAKPGHFGLRSMRERARAVGADVHVTSAVGAGTRVRVCVPRERSA